MENIDVHGNGHGGEEEAEENHCLSPFVDKGSAESHRFYLARRTVLEMLTDRGYLIPDEEMVTSHSLTAFRSVYGEKPDLNRLRLCVSPSKNPSKKVLVVFCGSDEIRKQTMVGILMQIPNKESLHRLILILQNKINSYAKKVLDSCGVKAEIFQITELLVNITKHVIMPKHEILTAVEKQKLLKKYGLADDKQLPQMLEKDALVRYYGLQKGQVMKFTYDGAVTEAQTTYRCVG